jgi:tetratricopeptide (TPR) repeat protein
VRRDISLPEGDRVNLPRRGRSSNKCSVESTFERLERTGSVSDISQAISALQKAVDLTPLTHSNRPTRLGNPGVLYLRRFERSGSLPDVAEAISVLHKAVRATPEGYTDPPERLNYLGVRRFEHTASLPDVAEAFSVFRRALKCTQEGYPMLLGLLRNLASALILRCGQGEDPTDISEAIAAQRRAVAITLPDDPSLPAQLSDLSTSLRRRYDHSGAITDVDDAISTMREAIKLTPDGQASLPVRLSNLGRSLGTRFRHTKDVSDISEAVAVMQRAMRLTPNGHASLSRRLIALAICFDDWSSEAGCSEHLATAISHYRSAANSPSSPPRVRLEAAENWGRAVKRYDSGSTQVIDAFDVAISLIALIAGLEQTVEGRYERLQNVSGVALEAAAAACKLERLDKAVEWLEQGRCLVWSQLNHLRTPLEDLRHLDTTRDCVIQSHDVGR